MTQIDDLLVKGNHSANPSKEGEELTCMATLSNISDVAYSAIGLHTVLTGFSDEIEMEERSSFDSIEQSRGNFPRAAIISNQDEV